MRGRPSGSKIRDLLQKILSVLKEAYGYEIWRLIQICYEEHPMTQRVIYYHLRVGVEEKKWSERDLNLKASNSWEGTTRRTMLKILKPIKIETSESQMILEVMALIRKVLARDKDIKGDFVYGRLQSFKSLIESLRDN